MTPFLLFDCYSSNEHDNGNVDIGVVALSHELATRIKLARDTFLHAQRSLSDLDSLSMWSYDCAFLAYHHAEALVGEKQLPSNGSYARIDGTVQKYEDISEPLEWSRMIIDHQDVWWEVAPRRSDVRISTAPISIETLLKMSASADVASTPCRT